MSEMWKGILKNYYGVMKPCSYIAKQVCTAMKNRDKDTLHTMMGKRDAISKGLLGPAYVLAYLQPDTEMLEWLCAAVAEKRGRNSVWKMGICRDTEKGRWPMVSGFNDAELLTRYEAVTLCAAIGTPAHLDVLWKYKPQKTKVIYSGSWQRFSLLSGDLPPIIPEDGRWRSYCYGRSSEGWTQKLTPLAAAVYTGNAEMLQALLSKGMNAWQDVSLSRALVELHDYESQFIEMMLDNEIEI